MCRSSRCRSAAREQGSQQGSPCAPRRGRGQRRRRQNLWAAQGGLGAIEFAVVVPFLSLLLVGVLDFGMAYWNQIQVANGARAGAEYAVKNGYDSAKIQQAATSATGLSGISASSPPPEYKCPTTSGLTPSSSGAPCASGGTAGQYVTVTTQASYSMIVPWPGISSPVTLTASAIVRIN